jgi:hypothetical protein
VDSIYLLNVRAVDCLVIDLYSSASERANNDCMWSICRELFVHLTSLAAKLGAAFEAQIREATRSGAGSCDMTWRSSSPPSQVQSGRISHRHFSPNSLATLHPTTCI